MAVDYENTPHAAYLAEIGAPLDHLHRDPAYSRPHAELPDSDSDSLPCVPPDHPAPAPSPSPVPPTASETEHDRFAELLKYALATSSLLNPHLADAIPLYPVPGRPSPTSSPVDLIAAPAIVPPATTAPAQDRPKMAWEPGWEEKGLDWDERSAAATLQSVLGVLLLLVLATIDFASSLFVPDQGGASVQELPTQVEERPVREGEPALAELAVREGHSAVLQSIRTFIDAAQSLDMRVARALNGIREVECITWGLGLSSPLPPVSRLEGTSRPGLASPLGFSSPSHSRTSSTASSSAAYHPPLRAKPLRAVLARTLDDLTRTINDARVALKALVQIHSAESTDDDDVLPPASEGNREEEQVDWDSSFGGVPRRRTSVRRNPNGGTGTPRRSRPTYLMGTAILGPFRDSTSPPPTPEQRTMSRFGVNPPSSTNPLFSSTPASAFDNLSLSLTELQASFEDVHAVRRGLLWRLLRMVDRSPVLGAAEWASAVAILDVVTGAMRSPRGAVDVAVVAEFGKDGIGSGSLDLGRTTAVLGSRLPPPGQEGGGAAPPPGAGQRPRPASWHRASAGSSSATLVEPPTTPSRGRPLSLSFPSTYSVYNSIASPTPTARRPPPATANFAPVNPGPSVLEMDFEAQATAMSLSLRTVAAKLHVVRSDYRQAGIGGDAATERLLKLHESIRGDLESLSRAWEGSRVAVKTLLRRAQPPPPPPLGTDEDSEANSVGSTSLDSIPDDGEDDDEDGSVFESELATPPDSTSGRPVPLTTPRQRPTTDEESFVVAEDAREQVFEGVVEARRRSSMQGGKLPREERIRLMRDGRKRMSGLEGGGGMRLEAGMVAELKDVLVLLKGRRKISADGPPDGFL